MIELHWQDKSIHFNVYQIAVVFSGTPPLVYVAGNNDPFCVDESVEQIMNMISEALYRERT